MKMGEEEQVIGGSDMVDQTVRIKCETEGIEEAQEQVEMLAEAYDGFPAQVTIKNCHDCTFNIYPSQTKFIEAKADD